MGQSLLSSTQSMRSSLYESVVENGRTYHKYKQGKYYLPNDDVEQDRLDLQHHLFMLTLDGRLHLAPVKNPQMVLDFGTGTGIWAIEYATQNPSTTVIGSDLSPIQPSFVPPNCRFEVDDADDEWLYTQKFDLIHARAMFSCFSDFPSIFRKAYDALAPGGYLEMQDIYFKPHSVDGSVEGTAMQRWNDKIIEGAKILGRDYHCVPKYAGWFREAGFVNVVERIFMWPSNTWPKGTKQKTLGLWMYNNAMSGAEAISMALLTRAFGMTPAEVEVMLVDVRKDLKNRSIHAYNPVYIVYGQKPLDA
ncbi:S-adenosyl-L-methionine-dependent methyltransferase [Xylogone sp. PMI_703]|nr:S-adenosyl-L-methionine-dependent methyltransferase [Xylogone sp. PMI_703]